MVAMSEEGNQETVENEPLNQNQENVNTRTPFLLAKPGIRSVWEVAFGLTNSTVGAGVIGLPYAIKSAGFGLGIILSSFVAFLSWTSLYLLITSGKANQHFKLANLAEATFGKSGVYLVTYSIIFNGIGSMLSYLIIIGDSIPLAFHSWAPDFFLVNRELSIVVASVLFILPILFHRNLGSLSKYSMLGVLVLPIILALVVAQAFFGPNYSQGHHPTYSIVGDRVFPSIGIMAFAFLCTHTAFMNYVSLKDPSDARWAKSSGLGVTMSLLVSLIFAIIGYAAFGDEVEGNMLLNFPFKDSAINVARLCLAVDMFVTFPTQFYPVRSSILKLIGWETPEKNCSRVQHRIISVILFAVVVVISLFVRDLGLVYELAGGIFATCLAYIVPSMIYIKTFYVYRMEIYKESGFFNNIFKSSQVHIPFLIAPDVVPEPATTSNRMVSTYSAENYLIIQPDENSTENVIETSGLMDIAAVVLLLFGIVALLASTITTITKLVVDK